MPFTCPAHAHSFTHAVFIEHLLHAGYPSRCRGTMLSVQLDACLEGAHSQSKEFESYCVHCRYTGEPVRQGACRQVSHRGEGCLL